MSGAIIREQMSGGGRLTGIGFKVPLNDDLMSVVCPCHVTKMTFK